MRPYKITIVGAGLTGALTASRLKKIFNDDIAITLLEKSRGAGGRMSTNRYPENHLLTSDLGAQYISASEEYYEKHKSFYDELLTTGALKQFVGKIVGPNRFEEKAMHYISPPGINSVVKHFLNQSESEVQYNTTVEKINFSNTERKVKVSSKDCKEEIESDAVILTMPVPQLFNLQGSIQALMKPNLHGLQSVQYSSRYAMALYFADNLHSKIPWTCKYIADNDCIRFISIDTAKRGVENSNGSSLVVHTTVPFGLEHLEQDFSIVEPTILANLKEVLPDLPEPLCTKCQRWRYSQVYKAYPNKPGCLLLNESPTIIAAGDSFADSNFDGCIESSTAVLDNLVRIIQSQL